MIIDLEDAVHPEAKAAARETMLRSLAKLAGAQGPPVPCASIRLTAAMGTEDLMAALGVRPDAIVLPKVEITVRDPRAV